VPLLDLAAVGVCLIAALALINARFLGLPSSIGVTLGGLLVSLLLVVLSELRVPLALDAVQAMRGIDFDSVVFQGVLSFLLFAGGLGLDTRDLWRLRWPVLTFALVATGLSIAVVGGLVYALVQAFGLNISLAYCLLFGTLISPTDPVAVLGMLKQARVPARIETLVAGESLFNDGVGVVAFAVLLPIAVGGQASGALDVVALFGREAVGGLLLGVALGYLGYLTVRSVDDFVTEMLLTLGLVLALTAIAVQLHVSAPLAAVAAGLLVGLLTDRQPQALSSRERFEDVWNLIDELLNVVLFALLALEIVTVRFALEPVLIGLIGVPLVLLARAVSVHLPYLVLGRFTDFSPFTRRLMIWGGLRGAISVALAFTVPAGPARDVFLVMTYVIVVFSIVVQGLTVGRLAERAGRLS
jgi:CPA1 family monovalent cation:H+ antiporter